MSLPTGHVESITAFHVATQEEMTLVLDGPPRRFESGGYEEKQWVSGHVGGVASAFVERANHSYTRSWLGLSEEGFPVVQDVYMAPGRGTVLIPNLRADSSELYGNALHHCLRKNKEDAYDGRNRQRDPAFIAATRPRRWSGGMAVIKDATEQWLARAERKGICMPHDTFELRVRPDDSAELIMLDIGDASFGVIGAAKRNRLYTMAFVHRLRDIRQRLTSGSQTP